MKFITSNSSIRRLLNYSSLQNGSRFLNNSSCQIWISSISIHSSPLIRSSNNILKIIPSRCHSNLLTVAPIKETMVVSILILIIIVVILIILINSSTINNNNFSFTTLNINHLNQWPIFTIKVITIMIIKEFHSLIT